MQGRRPYTDTNGFISGSGFHHLPTSVSRIFGQNKIQAQVFANVGCYHSCRSLLDFGGIGREHRSKYWLFTIAQYVSACMHLLGNIPRRNGTSSLNVVFV